MLWFKYLTHEKRQFSQEHLSVRLATDSTALLKSMSRMWETSDKGLDFFPESQAMRVH